MLNVDISIKLELIDSSEPIAECLYSFDQCDKVRQKDIVTSKLKYFEVEITWKKITRCLIQSGALLCIHPQFCTMPSIAPPANIKSLPGRLTEDCRIRRWIIHAEKCHIHRF